MEVSAHISPKLLVLPKQISPNAHICTLSHPRTSNPSRYLFCPEKGIFEFTKIAAPKSACQSWLIGSPKNCPKSSLEVESRKKILSLDSKACEPRPVDESTLQGEGSRPISDGYIAKSAEIFVATSIDPLFLILPSFCIESSKKSSPLKKLFYSLEDLLEHLQSDSEHIHLLLENDDMMRNLESRMKAVCDVVEAGSQSMYRLNLDSLLRELFSKAENLIALGLPASIEDKFIRKVLEEPMFASKRDENSISESEIASSKLLQPDIVDLSSAISSDTFFDTSKTSIELPILDVPSPLTEDVKRLLRIRTALLYLISVYIPPSIEAGLTDILSSPNSLVDFSSLDKHLAHLTHLRAQALTSRSLSDFSRKRCMNEDDEVADSRIEKKKRKEEEEKRKKAGESRGIKDLKKVDVSGMKKMSDFFGKGAVKKK